MSLASFSCPSLIIPPQQPVISFLSIKKSFNLVKYYRERIVQYVLAITCLSPGMSILIFFCVIECSSCSVQMVKKTRHWMKEDIEWKEPVFLVKWGNSLCSFVSFRLDWRGSWVTPLIASPKKFSDRRWLSKEGVKIDGWKESLACTGLLCYHGRSTTLNIEGTEFCQPAHVGNT